jgi:hypothetical protein
MIQYEIKVPITSKCSRSKTRNSPLGVNVKFMYFKIKGLLLNKEQHCTSKVQKESLESGSIFKDPSEPAGRNGKPHQLSLAKLGRSHIFAPRLPESVGSRTIVHLR